MLRIAGFLMMVAGWLIALAAILLLGLGPAQMAFLIASLAIQAIGLVFVVRSHLALRGEKH